MKAVTDLLLVYIHCIIRHWVRSADISEILASRNNVQVSPRNVEMNCGVPTILFWMQIAAIKEEYTRLFKRDLEKDIMSETGGNLKRIFVSLVQVSGKDFQEGKACGLIVYTG